MILEELLGVPSLVPLLPLQQLEEVYWTLFIPQSMYTLQSGQPPATKQMQVAFSNGTLTDSSKSVQIIFLTEAF
jgi:hypothetical protein